KPAGLNRTYPNILTYEGVMGAEQNKWNKLITPEHNVTIPFIRMAAGPMDYTPGAMNNASRKEFKHQTVRPMSMGTAAHQAALFVVFDSPLQTMADSPKAYDADKKRTSFLARIPTTWDETRALSGKIGEHIVM